MAYAHITSVNGTLVAELEGEKRWETTDVLLGSGIGYGEEIPVPDDFDGDGYELADIIADYINS